MQIKGLDQIRRHLPDLITPLGIVRLFLLPILLVLLVTAILRTGILNRPFWMLVTEVALGSLGFLLLDLFVRHRKDYRARFGPLAYSKAASRFGFPGVAIIAAVVAGIGYLPGPKIPPFWGYAVLIVLGWALIGAGVLLFLRTLQTFGLDNLIMLYVYFPEESRFVNHRIYSMLRHPAYSAAQHIAYGLALLNGNWSALAGAMIFSIGLWGWVRLVEERELVERFGQSYIEYRQQVPAFLPRLRALSGFFGFLIVGG